MGCSTKTVQGVSSHTPLTLSYIAEYVTVVEVRPGAKVRCCGRAGGERSETGKF
jgi:hypothetical protein